jgi:hypothetical protein
MASNQPLIRLWSLNGVGLIIAHPSGVRYSNQVGGYANFHPSIEGVFVPVMEPEVDQQTRLYRHFIGPKWQGHCYGGIDEETADFVDGVLDLSSSTKRIRVDRSRLQESEEAWIFVVFTAAPEDSYALFTDFPSGAGVLTWANSD